MSDTIFEESSQGGKLYYIQFPRLLKDEDKNLLENAVKTWMLRTEGLIVFDFSQCIDIEKDSTRIVLNFIRAINKSEKNVISINLSKSFEKKLKERGLDLAFNIKK